jgi:hypothetical protein
MTMPGAHASAPLCPVCGGPLAPRAFDPRKLFAEIHITPAERDYVDVLASRFGHWVTTESLIVLLWGGDPAGGPLWSKNILCIRRASVNPKLAVYGLVVDSGGQGHRPGRHRLRWL